MPPAAPLIAGAAAAASSALAGTTILGLGVAASAIAIGVGTVGIGVLSEALQPDPPSFDFDPRPSASPSTSPSTTTVGRTQQVRQAISERRVIYGEKRVSGPLVYAGTSNNNENLHLVIALAGHECEEIQEVWLNDVSFADYQLDSDGNVTAGSFADKVRIRKHLGTAGQAADSRLVSEVSGWTSSHRLRGVAYVYVRLKFDRDLFPTGIPSISAWVKGKKLYDPRDGGTRWSSNSALVVRDYLTNGDYGLGAASGEINDTLVEAAANICDEFVTAADRATTVSAVSTSANWLETDDRAVYLQTGDRVRVSTTGTLPSGLSAGTDYYCIIERRHDGGRIRLATSYVNALAGTPAVGLSSGGSGTHTITKKAEPRYTANGLVSTDTTPAQVMENILSSMGGRAANSGGTWHIRAGAYTSPTIELDESDVRGPIRVSTRHPRRERFNAVKGVYSSPINLDVPTDYPPVTNSTYEATDNGERLWRDRELPFTSRPHTAQRLAKIELERHRQEIRVEMPVKLTGLQLKVGDTVQVTNARFGWSAKVFEVVGWSFAVDGQADAPSLGVDLTLRETASAIFDWTSGEETAVDPAPNTDLATGRTVLPPTGLTAISEAIDTSSGDQTFKVVLGWAAPSDAFVTAGGRFEIQFRENTLSNIWRPSWFVDGEQTSADVYQVKPGRVYDARVRSVSRLGVRSEWDTNLGFTVVGSFGVISVDDWGAVNNTVVATDNWGSVADPATDSASYGFVSTVAGEFDWGSVITGSEISENWGLSAESVASSEDWEAF